ncbi:SusC/RagA family TonB-linked outer membrane protein [Arcticibacter eurypsychrophilus]|uniref:SusC/RagA family TonB-linked outer membrane protein n=1 Tax=Arcticibacter eurypsychrophilus TaxID=1434752 RepID=UPI000ABD47B4|nr:SusC/RagA family TonB-linked outer membrane protein [Arcticibacter eurypsychrophilus]
MNIIIRPKNIVSTKFIKMLLLTGAALFQLVLASFTAKSQLVLENKIVWGGNQITLNRAFTEVEKLSGITFNYNNAIVNDQKQINISRAERTVAETIQLLIKGTSLSYQLAGEKNVLIIRAQANGTLSGKVLDDNGEALPGASVRIIELNKSFTTDKNGSYSISVAPGTYTVEVKFISFETKRASGIKVTADKSTPLNFSMVTAANQLQEVMVTTALGIKREEKALGYSATVVTGKQLNESLSNNWTDALSGKVAGLNLVRSNAGPAGSNKIILRGESNLTGDNNALIVVDGVVINNGSGRATGSGSNAYLDGDSPVDFGTGLNDINSEDIESVTVLKGPGAAALYGQRGANGAIIITTKSGVARKGLGVSFNSNYSLESISRWPEYQNKYGQGVEGANYYSFGATADGASTRSTSSAWGPKFDGQEYFQYDPITHTGGTTRTPWVAYPDDRQNFFETGKTFTNNLTLDGGTENTAVRFSFTNVDNTWIIPNTGYNRNSVALSASQKVNDKLQISTKINYTNKWSDNLPNSGYNNQSIMYWNMFWEPNASVDWLKEYWLPGQENIAQSYPFSSYPDNPYLIANEMLNKSDRDGLTGNIQATYSFTKELSLLVRTSMDFASERRSQQRPYDTEKFRKGMFRTQNIFSKEASSDFLLQYKKKISKDVDLSVSAGGSMLTNRYTTDNNRADSLLYPGVFTLANKAGILDSRPGISEYNINSFYGLATMSYKNYLFLDITGRNDWNSVLATANSTNNVSFFYPSANASFILSEAFKLPKFISFAKIRASASGVGSGGQTSYQTALTYDTAPNFPGGLQNPSMLANLNLKSLFTTAYETGVDVRFLNNRLGFDLALYTSDTRDQILMAKADASSGYGSALVNGGLVRNKGIELAANGSPLKSQHGLNWNMTATFAANRNKVISLSDSVQQLTLQTGPGNRGAIVAAVGGSMGDLYGRGYQRSPEGEIVYENGYPRLTDEMLYLGNTTPKWRASMGNTFKYRQFSFNFLIDAQYGAVAYSLTAAVHAEQGKTKNTLPGRYNGIIGNGVIQNTDGTYRKNDVIAKEIWTYYNAHYGRDNVEGSSYSTDFVKLREARLDYTLTPQLSNRLGLQRVNIGVYGRNLLMITQWPGFDPEFGTLNNGDITQGFELGQFPVTRTFGLNLTIAL